MSEFTLNSDVLSQVFEAAVQSDASSLSTIRSVNREWFNTAGNTPKLWSKIELKQKVHFTSSEYVSFHLQKAGGIPLDITISFPDDLSFDTDMPGVALFREAVQRIRSLVLTVPFLEAWQKFVLAIGEGQAAPVLERLIITTKGDLHDRRNRNPYTTLSSALTPSPKLTQLQLPAWPVPAGLPPQFSTVTSLAFQTPLSGLDIPALFPIIHGAAPYLEHFKFKAVDAGAESDPNYSNIVLLPKLRSADVTTPGYGLDMLGNFIAPLLVEVRLDGYRDVIPDDLWEEEDWGWDFTQPSTAILTKLAERSPSIHRLELHYVHFESPRLDFDRILSGQAFPSLEELILERSDLQDTTLIENASRLPELKKLALRNCKYVTINGLLPFVKSHARSTFVLMVVECRGISKEGIESLSKFVCVKSER